MVYAPCIQEHDKCVVCPTCPEAYTQGNFTMGEKVTGLLSASQDTIPEPRLFVLPWQSATNCSECIKLFGRKDTKRT